MPPRRALSEISGNQIRKKELSPTTPGIIIGKRSKGAIYTQIYMDTGIPESTLKDIIKNAPER
jgi:hypothetical protein